LDLLTKQNLLDDVPVAEQTQKDVADAQRAPHLFGAI